MIKCLNIRRIYYNIFKTKHDFLFSVNLIKIIIRYLKKEEDNEGYGNKFISYDLRIIKHHYKMTHLISAITRQKPKKYRNDPRFYGL